MILSLELPAGTKLDPDVVSTFNDRFLRIAEEIHRLGNVVKGSAAAPPTRIVRPAVTTPVVGDVLDQGIAANRPSPSGADNTLYYASDRNILYGCFNGSWQYLAGRMEGTQAALAALTLTANDAGTPFYVTDYDHVLVWNGVAWEWGPGEHNDYVGAFENDPTGPGWKLCDGTGTTKLNADGTTSAVTTRNLVGGAYLKYGAAAAGPNAAVAPTIQAHATGIGVNSANSGAFANSPTLNNSASQNVQPGTGAAITVAAAPHNHAFSISEPGHTHTITDSGHNHTANTNGEPANAVARPWYRR